MRSITWEAFGQILLSELFAALDIEVLLSDIAEVTFTDPSLLAVTKVTEDTTYYALYLQHFDVESNGEDAIMEGSTGSFDVPVYAGDYLLTSLSPFDTEETLAVELVDGSVLSIRVTDPSSGSGEWDLAAGLDSNGNVIDQSAVNVTDLSASVSSTVTSTEQERNISLKLNLEYVLNSTALDELKAYTDGYPTLTYDLSTWLADAPVDIDPTSGKIRQGNNTVGTYTVDANGKVTLTITNLAWLRLSHNGLQYRVTVKNVPFDGTKDAPGWLVDILADLTK